MRTRSLPLLLLSIIVPLAGCSAGEPSVDSLLDSFAAQISSVEFVHDFVRDGDDITFLRPDGSGMDVEYAVHIDSALVEPNEGDDAAPWRGLVESTWRIDGRIITPSASVSNLPMWIDEAGIAQECWGLWDAGSGEWGW